MVLRPAAQFADLLALDFRGRPNRSDAAMDVRGADRTGAVHESVKDPALHGGFDLGAREAVGGFRQCFGVEITCAASAPAEMYAEDLGAVFKGRQVDEDDLTEAALTDLLGRQLAHGVGGRQHEY